MSKSPASGSALLMDLQTNKVIYASNPDVVVPIASVSKLMTALVVAESKASLDDVLTISQDDIDTDDGPREGTSLVVATGGLTVPKIGATPFGYRLAEQFGLAVVPPKPALPPRARAAPRTPVRPPAARPTPGKASATGPARGVRGGA